MKRAFLLAVDSELVLTKRCCRLFPNDLATESAIHPVVVLFPVELGILSA